MGNLMKTIYEGIPTMSYSEIASAIASEDVDKIVIAILSASMHLNSETAAMEICMSHLGSHTDDIVRSSLLGLGHIARIHRSKYYDIEGIERKIKKHQLDEKFPGNVSDLRRDIRVYIVKYHGIH